MSIKVSSINEYLYCPLKLYIKYHLELDNSLDKELNEKSNLKIIRQLRMDFQDMIRKNLLKIQKEMNASEINEILFQDVPHLLNKSMEYYEFKDDSEKSLLYKELENDLKVENTILALRIKKILVKTKKEPFQVAEMIFPPALQGYIIRDKNLEMSGSVDKIEIIDGKYYPVSRKSKNPPLRGIWDSDALEIAAHALLIEREFDTEVMVGFVDYENIGDRRPVIIDSELKEGLFIILDAIKDIINQGELPEVSINPKKCEKCSFLDICHQNLDFS